MSSTTSSTQGINDVLNNLLPLLTNALKPSLNNNRPSKTVEDEVKNRYTTRPPAFTDDTNVIEDHMKQKTITLTQKIFPDQEKHLIPIDCIETKTSFQIIAELPGVLRGDLKVSTAGNLLTITANKSFTFQENEIRTRECVYGTFTRKIPLSSSVNPQPSFKSFENGVLRLVFDKIALDVHEIEL